MGSQLLAELAHIWERGFNVSDDPRIGSSKDNGTSTAAFRITQGPNSASFSKLFATFIPVSVYAAICILVFVPLRNRLPRVYAPRSILSSLEPHERIDPLPSGLFNWLKAFYKVPDTSVLKHSSLDAYLFLRYLKILCVICGVGCLITWPVLLPLHRYGGRGNKELDLLTIGNVKDPLWFYVHVVQAWLFFGFVLYMISRECVYFINLRQVYLLSPYYAERLSSRTVLFTCVPQQILDERKLRKVFGDSAKHIWIPRDTDELDDLVKERDQTAFRLERAEISLIRKVNEAYMKAARHGHPDIDTTRWSQDSTEKDTDMSVLSVTPTSPRSIRVKEFEMSSMPPQSGHPDEDVVSPISPISPRDFPHPDGNPGFKTSYGPMGPPPDINGSVAAQWIPYSWRPVHRPLANYGRKVDTIKWTRSQLKELAPKIAKLKRLQKRNRGVPIPAAFIEFDTQANAQSAYQTLAHHRANHMAPDIVGVRPQEIHWPSLRLHWWERIIRKFAIQAFIAVMVVFWSIPAGIIGLISNIKLIADSVSFLRWIEKLPSPILGLISGLLPAVALSLLMSAVPFIMRACARQAGVTTHSKIELFTQNAYFVFQVVQVFLVTTLSSAVSGALGQIIKDPLSARVLLSKNLPTASNFYISYFILQGLAMSATRMVHLGSIIRHKVMRMAGGNPRVITKKYHRLRLIHWGAVYPVFTNMGVIAISYAMIAPLVLGVAFIGLLLIYATYRYNILYVYSSELDARGLHYPRALKQTLMGVYLAEICMVGLLGLGGSFGSLVMMLALLIFTALVNISLNDSLSPLLYNLPRTLAVEEELRRQGHDGLESPRSSTDDKESPDVEDPYDSDFDPSAPPLHGESAPRAVEGADQVIKLTATGLTSYVRIKYDKSPLPSLITALDFWTFWISPDPSLADRNVFIRMLLTWLHPEIFADYAVLRRSLPEIPEIKYTQEREIREAFYPPSVRTRAPRLWLPRDRAGVSRQEVAHSGKVILISDEGAWIDERGRLEVEMESDWREEVDRVRF